MPILMIGEAEGLTPELYAPIAAALEPAFRQAPGFMGGAWPHATYAPAMEEITSVS